MFLLFVFLMENRTLTSTFEKNSDQIHDQWSSLPPSLSHRVLHDLSPVSDQHQPECRAEHYHQEGPVELSCRGNISVNILSTITILLSPSRAPAMV